MSMKILPATPPNESDGPPGGSSVGNEIKVDTSKINIAGAKAAIKDKLDQMVTARKEHMEAVDAQVSKSKSIHSLTRHGAQTGWEAQLLRICTKLTPDQDYDEHGILPIRKVLEEHTVTKRKGDKDVTTKLKNRTGGGIAAGVFYSAEVQSELIMSCMTTIAVRVQPFPFCEIKLRTGEIQWVRYSFIHVYAIAAHGGSGVAYMKQPNFVKLEPAVVVEAIDDFLNIRTLRDRAKINFARERGFRGEEWKVDDFLAERRLQPGAAAIQRATPEGLRFRTWGDLLGFLKVRQILRNGARTEISLKAWNSPTIMTMMPETVDPMDAGFAPTTFVGPTGKNITDCLWTGGLRSADDRQTIRVVPPSWARAWPT